MAPTYTKSPQASNTKQTPSDIPRWLAPFLWLAYHWWQLVGILFLGNYVPGAIIEWIQHGWGGLSAYLTTWGLLNPLEQENPLTFGVVTCILVITALIGYEVARREKAAVKRKAAEREQLTEQIHDIAKNAQETASDAWVQIETFEPRLRTLENGAQAEASASDEPPQDVGLLPSPEPFVGRAAGLAWLEERLIVRADRGVGPVAVLAGLGGIGKSALAGKAIQNWRLHKRFADGLAVVLSNDQSDASALLRLALSRFDPRLTMRIADNATYGDLATVAHQLLDRKDALIVLDNIEPDNPGSGWRACDALNVLRATGVAVLVTARHEIPGLPVDATYQMDIMSVGEARDLFAECYSGQRWTVLSTGDQQCIDTILALLGRHTLAVTLAARYAYSTKRPLAKLAEELHSPSRALTLQIPDAPQSVSATFALSYTLLPEEAQRLFRAMGAAATNEIGRMATLALARRLEVAEPEVTVDLLVARGLTKSAARVDLGSAADSERLSLHPLLRAFVVELLRNGLERERAEDALARFYAGYIESPRFGANFFEAFPAIAADEVNIIATLNTAHARGSNGRVVAQLCWGLAQYWRNRGKNSEALKYLPWGIAAASALAQTSNAREDRILEARLQSVYGDVLRNTGKLAESQEYYEQSLATFYKAGERQEEGVELMNLGTVAQARGQLAEAQGYFEQSLSISRETHSRREEGVVVWNLGTVAQARGRLDEARALFEQSMTIRREVGDHRGEGIVLSSLGLIAQAYEQFDEAQTLFERSLKITRDVGDHRGEGVVLMHLGHLAWAGGRFAEARECLVRALALDQEVRNRGAEGLVMYNLGLIALSTGQLTEAQENFEQGREIASEVDDHQCEGRILSQLAIIAETKGDIDRAESLHRQSWKIALEVGNEQHIADSLAFLGEFLIEHCHDAGKEGCAMLTEAARRYNGMGTPSVERVRETMRRLGC